MLDRELKKGSAELLILSLIEDRARHGYEISKLIETRSGGMIKFNVASLYPLLYRLEARGWIRCRRCGKSNGKNGRSGIVRYNSHASHSSHNAFTGEKR